MRKINRLISRYNHNTGDLTRIQYIVIHYTGAPGDAEKNCKYFAGGCRNASAHYFIGHNGDIWQNKIFYISLAFSAYVCYNHKMAVSRRSFKV